MAQIRVNKGDSLWKIAKRNPMPGVSITERIRQIAAASGVSDPNMIKPGQVLMVPGGADEVPTPRMRPTGGPAPIASPAPTATLGQPERDKIRAQVAGLSERQPPRNPDYQQPDYRQRIMDQQQRAAEMQPPGPPQPPPAADPMADELMAAPKAAAPMPMPDMGVGAETPVTDAMIGGTPTSMPDPDIQALMADPQKRQALIQALMSQQGGVGI